MRNATYLILTLALVSLIVAGHIPVASARDSWKSYDFISTSIVAYDADSDGTAEILALPYYMIDNFVVVRSPYQQFEHGLLADVDLDGEKELVLYNMNGDFVVYKGSKLVFGYNLGGASPVLDLGRQAIAVGNKVLFNMSVYTFPDADHVIPVVAGNKLFVVYMKGSALYLEDTSGNKWTVYSDAIEPLGAVIYYGTLYLVGRAPLGGTVFIKYKICGSAQISGFTVELSRVLAWIPFDEAFIAEGRSGDIYRVKYYAVVLENTGRVLGCDDTYIYLYQDNKIVVYNPYAKFTRDTIETPVPGMPDVFGGSYPHIAVVYGRKTYVATMEPAPVGVLVMPSVVYAGEKVYYRLHTYNAVEATLTVNGTALPLEGYIVFNRTGTYTFVASLSNGLATVTSTYTVDVRPRPLVISLRVLGPAVAFSEGTVLVGVVDGLNGSRVEGIFCELRLPDYTVPVEPWKEVSVKFTPPTDAPETQVSVACGDDTFYERTEYSLRIPLQPTTATIRVDYLGSGAIRISFVSPRCSNCTVPGTVNVYLDGVFVSRGDTPYTLSGLRPGNHTVVVEFTPTTPLYRPARYTLGVTYYGNVSEVPSEILATVQVADRVEVVNNTVVQTETVTVPQPVYIEKPVLDMQKVIMLLGGGIAGGVLLGIGIAAAFLGRGGKRRREQPEEKKPGIEEEMAKYEVEVEKTQD